MTPNATTIEPEIAAALFVPTARTTKPIPTATSANATPM